MAQMDAETPGEVERSSRHLWRIFIPTSLNFQLNLGVPPSQRCHAMTFRQPVGGTEMCDIRSGPVGSSVAKSDESHLTVALHFHSSFSLGKKKRNRNAETEGEKEEEREVEVVGGEEEVGEVPE